MGLREETRSGEEESTGLSESAVARRAAERGGRCWVSWAAPTLSYPCVLPCASERVGMGRQVTPLSQACP